MNFPALRNAARLNLLTATVRTALTRRLIRLDGRPFEDVSFELEIANLPAIGCITDPGLGELTVHVIVAPTELGRQFACALIGGHKRSLVGEAVATGWLELRTGCFQEVGAYHGSDAITPQLARPECRAVRKDASNPDLPLGGRA